MFKKLLKKIKDSGKGLLADKSGDQVMGALIVVLIVIVIGGIALTMFSGFFTDIGPLMKDKILSIFSL